MTHLSQGDWERLVQRFPLQEGERPSDWMARLEEIASKRAAPEEPQRLPYRDEPDWREETVAEIFDGPRVPGEEG
jgi:hypothetical protein